MPEFTPHQLLLMRIRDELCGGNAAQLVRSIKKDQTYVNRLFYPIGKKGGKGVGLEIMAACTEAFKLHPWNPFNRPSAVFLRLRPELRPTHEESPRWWHSTPAPA
jgi:hypothetical protein